MKRKDLEYLKELAIKMGGVCLATEYVNNRTRYWWRCKQGHQWQATANNIQQGWRCPKCANLKRKKGIEYPKELAAKMGGACLATEYTNRHTPCLWMCSKNHQWQAPMARIQQGHWCPECALENRLRGLASLQKAASQRNGICLSTEYLGKKAKHRFRCAENHEWEADAGSIFRGYWCPKCAVKDRTNGLSFLEEIASRRGGRCLSTEYKNNKTKYVWRCSKGHIWEAKGNCVQQGCWCPICAKHVSKQEQDLFAKIKKIYPDALPNQKGLLSNKKFELDIYIPSLDKAIEFDGTFWHSRPKAIERDARKNQQCQEAGIKLLRVNESEWTSNSSAVLEKVLSFLCI